MTMGGGIKIHQEIKILIAILSKMDAGVTYQPHTHPFYQLNHIVRGSYQFTVGGRTFKAGAGDTILIPANCVHTFTQTGSEAGYYFEVKFSSFSKGLMEMCSDVGILVQNDDFSGKLLKEILDEKNNSTPKSEKIMITYLYAILFKLTKKTRHEKTTSSKYIEVSAYSAPVRDTIRFLEDNYKERLSLDDIVAHASLKKSHLSSLFKKETSVTIFECLMIIRVRKAVELLSYTDLPLAQISKETGFVNITHFNRVFAKHVFIPPGQFRKYLNSQDLYWKDATAVKKISHITAAALEGKKIEFPQFTLNN
ncbi:AraC family transcriptional regulator [Desulfotruncus alcoholivorax]|uniref:AraC family transcriptional regulator n=1 Tax=Desulfotruncus alcoholivorax TaxID=265477 RepID=UPI0009D793DB|nr:AraC family transcriptional regulator [Desulfotruncus alcoholivorax]